MTAEKVLEKILKMPKYRNVEIPQETVLSLIEQSIPLSKNQADLEKRVREKIHNIVALYLGDLDYEKATDEFRQIKDDLRALKEFSKQALAYHASTKERGHDLEALYQTLFSRIGKPHSIADLACGLHPLGLPFMDLPINTAYYAYDLHKSRVDFLNVFITAQGYSGGCFHQDILTSPPNIKFDAAFFFKEAHRFEKRQPGIIVDFLESIQASKVVVSLPTQSFGRNIHMLPKYEKIIAEYASVREWGLDSFEFGGEMFYIVDRHLK